MSRIHNESSPCRSAQVFNVDASRYLGVDWFEKLSQLPWAVLPTLRPVGLSQTDETDESSK